VLLLLLQVPPGGTNFQFRDPTEGRHAVYNALTSKDNPNPLPQDHYALAIGVQSFCLGGAGIFTAPDMAGPWTYRGSLFNQIAPEHGMSVWRGGGDSSAMQAVCRGCCCSIAITVSAAISPNLIVCIEYCSCVGLLLLSSATPSAVL
jgi:hypothetical protein